MPVHQAVPDTVSGSVLRMMLNALEGQGVDTGAMLRQAGIDPESLRPQLAGQKSEKETIVVRVTRAIRETIAENGLPRKENVSARLQMNPRTLLRRLQAEGTGFQQVLDDVRREMAVGLARDTTLNQKTIATMLGFSEIRSVQRSYRRWFGSTFSEVQRAEVGAGAARGW